MKALSVTNKPWCMAARLAAAGLIAVLGCLPGAALAQAPAPSPTAVAPAGPAGAQAWIEFPTEGQILPLAPALLVIYATDPGGVARIELTINGVPPYNDRREITFDAARRLIRLEKNWVPEKEGKYVLEARGVSLTDVYGEPDFVTFCVGTCEGVAQPTPTPMIVPSPTSPPQRLQLTFTADRTYMVLGGCAVLTWKVEGPVALVQLNGHNVPPFAKTQVCPPQTTKYTVVATGTDGQSVSRELTIQVEPPPPTATAPPRPTLPPPPPTPTLPPRPTLPPPPTPVAEIQFWADSTLVAAGSCTMLYWHVTNVKAYWVDGQPGAGDDGSRQVCPCQTETHILHVVKADGSEQDFPVTIQVRGSCVTPTPTQGIRLLRTPPIRLPLLVTPTPTQIMLR